MSTRVTVRPVSSKKDLKRFIDFQYDLYRDYPAWVAPLRRDVRRVLNPRKNAFFEHSAIHSMLAEDASGRVVGRIAAVVNGMHLQKYDDGNGFFGFFETIDDYAVAEALLDAAIERLRSEGLTGVRGPANPSLNDTAGLLVGGFDREPSVLMPYNAPYYEAFLERHGFERAMTMWAYYIHKKYASTERLERGVEIVKQRNPGIRVRTIDMDRFEEEARTILHIYNDAWSNNWGHVPMTEGEFGQLAGEMKQIVDPNIVFILEDAGRPVAFSISLPNINQLLRHVDDGRLLPFGLPKMLAYAKWGGLYECRTPLMGVLREYQGRGLDAVLNLAVIQEGPRNGYDASEMSWVLDSNKRLRNALESFGGVVDKEYAMFEKRIE
ncbi:MAG: hypothetical protein WD021_08075 [Rhodothermales bacterium]